MTDEEELFFLESKLPSSTPEGLSVGVAVKDGRPVMQEKGKFDHVIFEYPDGREADRLAFLIERLRELDGRYTAMARETPLALEVAGWRWNRRRAAPRLKRWFREHRPHVLELPDPYHALVDAILKEVHRSVEFDPAALKEEWDVRGGNFEFHDYKRRQLERPVIVVTSLPSAPFGLLDELNEAFCHGLFRTTAALCRAIIEDAFRRGADRWPDKVQPTSCNGLLELVRAFNVQLLSEEEKCDAVEIVKRGNQAMHDSDVRFDEEGALETLTLTCRLVRRLAKKGFFEEDGGPAS